VNNDFQGKGIGKIVLQELIVLKKQGLHTMIGVIDAENQSSVVFQKNLASRQNHKRVLLLNLTVGCILFYAVDLE
jgi:L-amino acid N-acyltransferase YncA